MQGNGVCADSVCNSAAPWRVGADVEIACAGESPFSMLGLGDVVIPGIFVAMCLRYDVEHGSSYFRR